MKQPNSAVTKSTQAISRESLTKDLLAESTAGSEHQILWIDGVGGYLLIDKPEIVIGQAVSAAKVDVCIVGDLSRQAAAIRRAEGDYLLQPLQPTKLNGSPIERPQLLGDESEITLGERIKIKFTRPTQLSSTARIELASLNRFKPNVDGILLLGDSCILGPSSASHIVCPSWKNELLLFRHKDGWFFRTLENVEVDGQPAQGQIAMVAGMRMRGEDFSLSIE